MKLKWDETHLPVARGERHTYRIERERTPGQPPHYFAMYKPNAAKAGHPFEVMPMHDISRKLAESDDKRDQMKACQMFEDIHAAVVA